MYLYANNTYGWEMSQNLPVKDLNRKKNTSKFNADNTKIYDENRNRY